VLPIEKYLVTKSASAQNYPDHECRHSYYILSHQPMYVNSLGSSTAQHSLLRGS